MLLYDCICKYILINFEISIRTVPGKASYADVVEDNKKKILIIGENQVRRINRKKLQNSFKAAKIYTYFFGGASVQDLDHDILPFIMKDD